MRVLAMLMLSVSLTAMAQNYKLGPSDEFKVTVLELNDMSGQYQVDSGGNVNLPYVGQLSVMNKTLEEVRELLAEKLIKADLVKEPQVIVDITAVNYKPISVIGAVQNPGKLDKVVQATNLVDVLTRAGGVAERAGDTILVMRTSEVTNLTATLKISYEDLLIKGDPHLNIPIQFGDTINIPIEKPVLISILGEITKPGEYEFKSNSEVSLLRVIAMAGGFTDFAKRHKVAVRRNGEELKVDVRAIQEKGAPDFLMQDGDIVSVP